MEKYVCKVCGNPALDKPRPGLCTIKAYHHLKVALS